MSTDTSFLELFNRVRAGDGQAAEELVRAFEGDIRRAIRVRMTDARLRQLVDSVDICQSVLADFFVQAVSGLLDVRTPAQLVALLVAMTRNRITDHARRQQAERRDNRRTVSLDELAGPSGSMPGAAPTPSAVAVGRELLEQIRERLSPEERRILEWRAAGNGWTEIAEFLGTKPNTVRMRYVRALDRVSSDLGIEFTAHA